MRLYKIITLAMVTLLCSLSDLNAVQTKALEQGQASQYISEYNYFYVASEYYTQGGEVSLKERIHSKATIVGFNLNPDANITRVNKIYASAGFKNSNERYDYVLDAAALHQSDFAVDWGFTNDTSIVSGAYYAAFTPKQVNINFNEGSNQFIKGTTNSGGWYIKDTRDSAAERLIGTLFGVAQGTTNRTKITYNIPQLGQVSILESMYGSFNTSMIKDITSEKLNDSFIFQYFDQGVNKSAYTTWDKCPIKNYEYYAVIPFAAPEDNYWVSIDAVTADGGTIDSTPDIEETPGEGGVTLKSFTITRKSDGTFSANPNIYFRENMRLVNVTATNWTYSGSSTGAVVIKVGALLGKTEIDTTLGGSASYLVTGNGVNDVDYLFKDSNRSMQILFEENTKGSITITYTSSEGETGNPIYMNLLDSNGTFGYRVDTPIILEPEPPNLGEIIKKIIAFIVSLIILGILFKFFIVPIIQLFN